MQVPILWVYFYFHPMVAIPQGFLCPTFLSLGSVDSPFFYPSNKQEKNEQLLSNSVAYQNAWTLEEREEVRIKDLQEWRGDCEEQGLGITLSAVEERVHR